LRKIPTVGIGGGASYVFFEIVVSIFCFLFAISSDIGASGNGTYGSYLIGVIPSSYI